MAKTDWSDEGLDRRVAAGLASTQHAAHVKAELPSPRAVEVAPADVVFHDRIGVQLGGVTLDVRHVGGDHSADASVIFVEPDGVLFLGDCLGASPEGVLTPESAFRLRDVILGFVAQHYIEGHHEAVASRSEMEELFKKMQLAETAAREGLTIDAPDEDTEYFLEALKAGHTRGQVLHRHSRAAGPRELCVDSVPIRPQARALRTTRHEVGTEMSQRKT